MPTTTKSTTVASTPYERGVELRIRSHDAPVPFGPGYGPSPRPAAPVRQDGRAPDRVAFALDNPPIETLPPSGEEHTFTITCTKTLRRFGTDPDTDGGGANVVTGYLDGNKAAVYVAKIYDGVYYPLERDDKWDCMLLADYDYAVEYWAYRMMQAVETVGAKLVPSCFGSWTFSLATDQPGRRRWVRMLLLQLVPGETMLAKIIRATKDGDIQYSLLPPEEFRLRVLKNLFEASISIWWDAEVLHMDNEPRNVMVQNDGSVVILDFNQAIVYRFFHYHQHPKHDDDAPKCPLPPIERYWPFIPSGTNLTAPAHDENPWGNWIPESWLKTPELAAEWLLETWKDASPNKYRPLDDYFLNHPGHAERGPKALAMLEKLGRKPAVKK